MKKAVQVTAFFACASIAFASATTQMQSKDDCIPAHQFIELLPEKVGGYTNDYGERTAPLGMYMRVSPDGRYILRSFSGAKLGDVTLIELPDPHLRLTPEQQATRVEFHPTPLENEAFPVQGSWRYLVNPNGEHYRFEDIVRLHKKAQPVFKGGMTGFYAAAAELPVSNNAKDTNTIRIRSMSWPNADGDDDTQGVGNLYAQTITVDTQTHRVVDSGDSVRLCDERVAKDGSLFALPMISTDGLEFSALPQKLSAQGTPTMHIYRFGASGGGCALADAFKAQSGKTIFGYANGTQAAPLAYEFDSQIWWYERDSRTPYLLAPQWEDIGVKLTKKQRAKTSLLANGFPGITRDGRVIYGAKIRYCATRPCRERVGIVITDPYQSASWRNAHLEPLSTNAKQEVKQCIRYRDIKHIK